MRHGQRSRRGSTPERKIIEKDSNSGFVEFCPMMPRNRVHSENRFVEVSIPAIQGSHRIHPLKGRISVYKEDDLPLLSSWSKGRHWKGRILCKFHSATVSGPRSRDSTVTGRPRSFVPWHLAPRSHGCLHRIVASTSYGAGNMFRKPRSRMRDMFVYRCTVRINAPGAVTPPRRTGPAWPERIVGAQTPRLRSGHRPAGGIFRTAIAAEEAASRGRHASSSMASPAIGPSPVACGGRRPGSLHASGSSQAEEPPRTCIEIAFFYTRREPSV